MKPGLREILKNSDFILECKMAELNQNKNSKQPDQADVMWKLYFTLAQVLTRVLQNHCPKIIRKSPRKVPSSMLTTYSFRTWWLLM